MKYKIPLASGEEITFRTLTASESDRYAPAIKEQDNPLLEEYLFNLVTDNLYSKKLDFLCAGTIPMVLYACLNMSGFIEDRNGLANSIDSFRDKTKNSGFGFFYAMIIKYAPAYKIEELKQFSLNELLEAFAIAEMIKTSDIIDTDKIRVVVADPKKERVINILNKDMISSLAKEIGKGGLNMEGLPLDLERDFFV